MAKDALMSVMGVAVVSVDLGDILLEGSGTFVLLEKNINPKREIRITIATAPTSLLIL